MIVHALGMSHVSAPPLPFDLSPQGFRCQILVAVALINQTSARADATIFLHQQEPTKQIWLYINQIKSPLHVTTGIDAAKKHGGGHAASREIVLTLTP
jgi:hypothetical protein